MQKIFIFLLIFLSANSVNAQGVYDGDPMDSTIIRFTNDSIKYFIPDTAASPLWQIGKTNKSFYQNDTLTRQCMLTDTLLPYPVNANNWFIIKIAHHSFNTIIDFWHKYKTDSTRDGGIVEFSTDSGLTWQNIKGDCNIDSGFGGFQGIFTENFYSFYDTLPSGEPAFTGASGNVSRYSRFQFFDGYPVKSTSPGCTWGMVDTFYVRFRFVSDSIADTLAGWEIDSIKLERDYYSGSVARITNNSSLNVYPNPSFEGHFSFPAIANEQLYSTEVYNNIGQRVLQYPYSHYLDMSSYPSGVYFYKVSNGTQYYSGRLLKE